MITELWTILKNVNRNASYVRYKLLWMLNLSFWHRIVWFGLFTSTYGCLYLWDACVWCSTAEHSYKICIFNIYLYCFCNIHWSSRFSPLPTFIFHAPVVTCQFSYWAFVLLFSQPHNTQAGCCFFVLLVFFFCF